MCYLVLYFLLAYYKDSLAFQLNLVDIFELRLVSFVCYQSIASSLCDSPIMWKFDALMSYQSNYCYVYSSPLLGVCYMDICILLGENRECTLLPLPCHPRILFQVGFLCPIKPKILWCSCSIFYGNFILQSN